MQNSDNKLHNDHNDDDDDEQFLFDMAEMLVEPPTKRVICSQCQ
mgnify:FL=1